MNLYIFLRLCLIPAFRQLFSQNCLNTTVLFCHVLLLTVLTPRKGLTVSLNKINELASYKKDLFVRSKKNTEAPEK